MDNSDTAAVKFIAYDKLLTCILIKYLRKVLYPFFVRYTYKMFGERTTRLPFQGGKKLVKKIVLENINNLLIPFFRHARFLKAFGIIVRLFVFLYSDNIRNVVVFFPSSCWQRNDEPLRNLLTKFNSPYPILSFPHKIKIFCFTNDGINLYVCA